MSVLLDEETDTVILEGLDFEIPCIVIRPAEHAAEVSIECRFCPYQSYRCRDHWERQRAKLQAFLEHVPGAVVYCATCQTAAKAIEDLVTVVTL